LTRIAYAAMAHWGYPEEGLTLWRNALTITEDLVTRSPVYGAWVDGTLVGFYALSGAGDVRALEHLWVLPARMSSGIGRTLVRHLLTLVRAGGGHGLRIASDPNAEASYLRLGARRVGEVPSTPTGRTLPLLLLDAARAV
jgi:GNAT superfamily N-acetyltransferase